MPRLPVVSAAETRRCAVPPTAIIRYPERDRAEAEDPSDGSSLSVERLRVYRSAVAPAYHKFRRRLVGWNGAGDLGRQAHDASNVGLLTFPNSGTSWFARVALAATGICRHTVYRDEAANPLPSRGVFALHPGPHAALPTADDPVLVKSHVRFFASGENQEVSDTRLSEVAGRWQEGLPAGSKAIRLVRNPVDNMRARYHHYLKKRDYTTEYDRRQPSLSFSEFLTSDITNYLVWHSCCDLADGVSVLSLDYDELLAGAAGPFLDALQFAGFQVAADDVERALTVHPPKYSAVPESRANEFLPVHLDTYSLDDLEWMGLRLQQWVDELEFGGAPL